MSDTDKYGRSASLAALLRERFGDAGRAEAERVTRADTPQQISAHRRVLTGADKVDRRGYTPRHGKHGR